MTKYWPETYFLSDYGAPMVQSEFPNDAQRPFFLPRIFSGLNILLEKGMLLIDPVDLIAWESKKKKAFIVTGKKSGSVAPRLMSPFEKRFGFKFKIWDGSKPDTPIDTVEDCARQMREFKPDLIFALGGGSPIDTAKAAWLLYEHPEANIAQLSPLISLNLRNKAKLVAVPTTSGTGSEVSGISVVSFPDGVKLAMTGRMPEMVPDYALLYPPFTVGMPQQLTAGTGGDALAHAVDAFLVPRSNELNQAIALKTIKMIFEWLPRAYHDGRDMMARAKMQMAAMMAGIVLGNAGSGITHGLGHTVGGLFHIHHGALVLLFIPYQFQVYSKVSDRYLELCDMFGIREKSDQKSLNNLIDKTRGLMTELNMHTSLKAAGVKKEELDKNLETVLQHASFEPAFYYGWFTMTRDQIRDILYKAYEGEPLDMNSELWR
jgi:alcohol dehydrogenase class IV